MESAMVAKRTCLFQNLAQHGHYFERYVDRSVAVALRAFRHSYHATGLPEAFEDCRMNLESALVSTH